MGLLDDAPDLGGTIFSNDDLARARTYLLEVIERLDPTWLTNPVGPIGQQWQQHGISSATTLIRIAQTIYHLDVGRNLTQRSQQLFRDKVRGLLRPPSDEQFEERLVEIEVASVLSQRASPIALEPLVPEDSFGTGAQPASPDLGLRLPHGDTLIEVTVLRVETLRRWDLRSSEITKRLSHLVMKRGGKVAVELVTPLSLSPADEAKICTIRLANTLVSAPSGTLTIELTSGVATVSWTAMPIIGAPLSDLPAGVDFGVVGDPAAAFGISHRPELDDEWAVDGIRRSVANTFKRKRRQLGAVDAPYYLALALGHHRLRWEGIIPLIQELLGQRDFSWLSGVICFTPQRSAAPNDPAPALNLIINDRARRPVESSIIAIFSNTETYHLDT